MEELKFRQELKYTINYSDWMQLRGRLRLLARPDENTGGDGGYRVRSLYFDNYRDKAVVEKLSGTSRREKFRLRYYGDDTGFIRLEKKTKVKRLVGKQMEPVDAALCARLLGPAPPPAVTGETPPLLAELYAKMQSQQLRPRMIVDYHREAYVYRPGNVRITIDSRIRISEHVTNFLVPDCVTIPSAAALILEVKFDEFLPDIMRDAVQLGSRSETEFSKYVVSRLIT